MSWITLEAFSRSHLLSVYTIHSKLKYIQWRFLLHWLHIIVITHTSYINMCVFKFIISLTKNSECCINYTACTRPQDLNNIIWCEVYKNSHFVQDNDSKIEMSSALFSSYPVFCIQDILPKSQVNITIILSELKRTVENKMIYLVVVRYASRK